MRFSMQVFHNPGIIGIVGTDCPGSRISGFVAVLAFLISVTATPTQENREESPKQKIQQLIADYESTLPPGSTGEIPAAEVKTTVQSFLKTRKEKVIKGFLPWQMPIENCCFAYHTSLEFCLTEKAQPKDPDHLCRTEAERYLSCRVNMGNSAEGKHWLACYHNEPRQETVNKAITAEDIDEMKCFIDYHWRYGPIYHEDCVGVNSVCAETYMGPIRKARYPWELRIWPWHHYHPISAQCSRTMQGAVESYGGVMVENYLLVVWALEHDGDRSEILLFSGDEERDC